MDRRKKGGFRTTLFASCWTPGWPAELTKRSRFPLLQGESGEDHKAAVDQPCAERQLWAESDHAGVSSQFQTLTLRGTNGLNHQLLVGALLYVRQSTLLASCRGCTSRNQIYRTKLSTAKLRKRGAF
jgi:hypothetical protein